MPDGNSPVDYPASDANSQGRANSNLAACNMPPHIAEDTQVLWKASRPGAYGRIEILQHRVHRLTWFGGNVEGQPRQ